MGILSALFRRKPKTAWDALQDDPLFQQQKALFDAMSALCSERVDANELPNGRGEFGLSATNPIPCKTAFGSTAYLGRLRASDGTKIAYERIGSDQSDVSPNPVDAYDVKHRDGRKLATIYISPYHQRISERAPKGFTLAEHSFA